MSELKELDKMVLAINDETDAEYVCEVIDRIDQAKRMMKELDATLKESLIDWINRNGEINIGTKRYYVGTSKKTKARDMTRLCEAAITEAGGDFDAFAEVLSANAFKPGACKALLGDKWGQHFAVEIDQDVKTGKAKKSVQVIDEKFIKGGR